MAGMHFQMRVGLKADAFQPSATRFKEYSRAKSRRKRKILQLRALKARALILGIAYPSSTHRPEAARKLTRQLQIVRLPSNSYTSSGAKSTLLAKFHRFWTLGRHIARGSSILRRQASNNKRWTRRKEWRISKISDAKRGSAARWLINLLQMPKFILERPIIRASRSKTLHWPHRYRIYKTSKHKHQTGLPRVETHKPR